MVDVTTHQLPWHGTGHHPRQRTFTQSSKLQDVLSNAMQDPEHVSKLENQGLGIKIMVGEEYAKYYRELHAKAAKYTEWARSRPHK